MTSLVSLYEHVMLRELRSLRLELEAFPDEPSVWALPTGLPNSAGTLALHLAGNLQHYIGARLGGTGYVRDRAREFAARDLPRATLYAELAEAEAVVRRVLPALTDADLTTPFPEAVRDQVMETGDFLLHLAVHLGYHLGQASYHRRVVTGNATGVGALATGALKTARAAG